MRKNVFVLLGATGSLASEKIIPALDKIDAEIVLYARRPIKSRYQYVNGSLDNFQTLVNFLKKKSVKQIFFYLALPPSLYLPTIDSIEKYFGREGISIALEKPFGTSSKNALTLAKKINEFGKNKFYLIDHYLAKEALLDFLSLPQKTRSKTTDLQNISSVEIGTLSKDSVAHRGEFYDAVGAINDTVQNHLLNIFAAVFSSNSKVEVLKNLKYKKGSMILGQYREYKKTKGVSPNSKTETYFSAKFMYTKDTDHVVITFRTGISLNETHSYIKIFYKDGEEFVINIKPYPKETKDSHEYIIQDFLSLKKEYSLTEEEALESWKVIDQVSSTKDNVPLKIYPIGAKPGEIEKI